jgi:hypothetical protein
MNVQDKMANYVYKSVEGMPVTKESIQAFIDILGFQGNIEKSYQTKTSHQLLIFMRKALESGNTKLISWWREPIERELSIVSSDYGARMSRC